MEEVSELFFLQNKKIFEFQFLKINVLSESERINGGWSFWEISASDCIAQKSIAKMRLIIHHPYSFSISVTSFHSLPLIRHSFFLSVYLFHTFFLFLSILLSFVSILYVSNSILSFYDLHFCTFLMFQNLLSYILKIILPSV